MYSEQNTMEDDDDDDDDDDDGDDDFQVHKILIAISFLFLSSY